MTKKVGLVPVAKLLAEIGNIYKYSYKKWFEWQKKDSKSLSLKERLLQQRKRKDKKSQNMPRQWKKGLTIKIMSYSNK
uniref:Transposase n=1 Tax=Strongyloides papillosus TaxID=174720 RepID=A0A0N5BWL5_STREA